MGERETNKHVFVVAFDGLPAAGKSTAIKNLAKRGSLVIGEYSTFFPIPREFPPQSEDEAYGNYLCFMQIEAFRKQTLDTLTVGRGLEKPVILDRSFLSPVAFEYAARTQSGYDLFDYAVEDAIIQKRWIIIPNRIFYFDVDPKTAYLRADSDPTKNRMRRHFYKEDFPEKHKEFYELVADAMPGFINFVDANRKQELVANEVITKLDALFKRSNVP